MTFDEVIAAATAARNANVRLSKPEWDGVYSFLQSRLTTNDDIAKQGTLRGIMEVYDRQERERVREQVERQGLEGQRELAARKAKRREAWKGLDPMIRAAYLSGEPRLLRFAQLATADTTATEPDHFFMPELVGG